MTLSKFIPSDFSSATKPWHPSEQAGTARQTSIYHEGPAALGKSFPTIHDIETIKQKLSEQSYQAGHGEGYADGMRIANEELASTIKAISSALTQLENPLQSLDRCVKYALVDLAIIIAKQMITTEISYHPEQIMPLVDEAIRMMSVTEGSVYIHLNPEDARIVEEVIKSTEHESRLKIIAKDDIHRGGCRLNAENSSIDWTIEKRIAQAVQQFFTQHSNNSSADAT